MSNMIINSITTTTIICLYSHLMIIFTRCNLKNKTNLKITISKITIPNSNWILSIMVSNNIQTTTTMLNKIIILLVILSTTVKQLLFSNNNRLDKSVQMFFTRQMFIGKKTLRIRLSSKKICKKLLKSLKNWSSVLLDHSWLQRKRKLKSIILVKTMRNNNNNNNSSNSSNCSMVVVRKTAVRKLKTRLKKN